MLLEHRIKPIIVFDGAAIPVKRRIQEERAKQRINSRQKIISLLKEGKVDDAKRKYGESFTITPFLVHKLADIIGKMGWKWIISPYEADAQLAYLFKTNKVEVIFTEDSDLIAYGVTKLFYKLDNDGNGDEINTEALFGEINGDSDKIREGCLSQNSQVDEIIDLEEESENSSKENNIYYSDWERSLSSNQSVNKEKLPVFSENKFLSICILAGWDYIEPIKGIGFKTAYKLMNKYKTVEKLVLNIISSKKYTVPRGYLENYYIAYMTFLFQIVYDYEKEIWLNLTEPNPNDHFGKMFLEKLDKDFWGIAIPKAYGKPIWTGEIDIKTKMPINLENLFEEYTKLNDPWLILVTSDSDEEKSPSIKEITDLQNGPYIKKKKPFSVRKKKINFNIKATKKKTGRIPSPFKNRIAEDMKKFSADNKYCFDKHFVNKKRTFTQLSLMDLRKGGESSEEDEAPSNTLSGIFKRAKRREEDQEWADVVIPKLQTIKKKTFMRSLASGDIKF